MLFLIPHREIRMQWSLQKGTEMSVPPCHSNSFDGVGREGEGRSSILALSCHRLGGCWRCSKLPSAIRGAAVWELEVQPRGHGPILPFTGMCGDAEPRGLEPVLRATMALFGVLWFGLWHVGTGCAALRVKDCISWLLGTQREAPALKGMLYSGFLFLPWI